MDNVKSLLKKYFHLITGKTKEIREDGNALIFLVFLFVSMCFWILNALQKDNYTTEVNYPVRFTNSSDTELVNGNLKRNLTLKIKGGGFGILKYHLNDQFLSESIDLSELQRIVMNGSTGAILSSTDYYKQIEGKLANGMELVNIAPDTLFIPLMKKVSKKLPIQVKATVSFKQQCQYSGPISVVPDSIVVSGPENVLDSLQYVSTNSLNYEKLSDTLVRNVELADYDLLELETKRVVITIPVEPFTEAFVMVPVKAIGLPDSLVLKSFPSEVKVSYHIGLSRKLYRSRDFDINVDFSSIDIQDPPSRLKVKLSAMPEQIHNMSYSPLFVEYLLEKK